MLCVVTCGSSIHTICLRHCLAVFLFLSFYLTLLLRLCLVCAIAHFMSFALFVPSPAILALRPSPSLSAYSRLCVTFLGAAVVVQESLHWISEQRKKIAFERETLVRQRIKVRHTADISVIIIFFQGH